MPYKLNFEDVRVIRYKHSKRTATRKQLAKEFGISYPMVLKIIRHEAWVMLDIDDRRERKQCLLN